MTVTKPIEEYAVWTYLRDTHCAFLKKRVNQKLCTNNYTVNGTHHYMTCPLIADNYLTVKLEGTTVVAFKKNPGKRIPSQMWESIELPQTKEEGLQELTTYAEQLELHPALKTALLTRSEMLYEIAEELKSAPEPEEEEVSEEEDIDEDDLLEEEGLGDLEDLIDDDEI